MRWVLVILSLASLALCENKVQVTRTQLHVARSLNPDETETRTVRTRTGEMATLVVKRRDGRQSSLLPPEQPDNFPKTRVNITTSDNSIDRNRTAKQEASVPNPVVIKSSTVLVKDEQKDWKRGRNLMKIDKDGIPEVTGVRMPDSEEDKTHVWRNARVINGKLVPNEKTQEKHQEPKTPAPTQNPGKIEWLKMEPITRPIQPPVQDNNWYKVSDSRVVPQNSVYGQGSPDAWTPAQYPPRGPVQVIAQPIATVSDDNRYVTDKILEYIKAVNRDEVLNRQRILNGRDSRGLRETTRMQARVLHTPGANIYPTSLLYAPPSGQNSRVRVEEGVRTPILHYAHPELGVQSALVRQSEDEIDNGDLSRDKALAYFAHDIHSDRSPFAFEPGLEDEARVDDLSENDKRSNTGYSHRPKKTLSYFPQDQAIPYSNKHYGKYNGYKDQYHYKLNEYTDRRPFWEKLGDSIREHVEYGVGRVQDITRPVMEPLVEATHKISENLGFNSGNRDLNTFKEKLGVASSSSMLLPAIGLVAGGAALGLGAVAVGRFLDVDLLKRSASSGTDPQGLQLEHKRALEAIAQGGVRTKRSLDEESLQRTETVQPQTTVTGIHDAVWASTPCAKRVFCRVLTSAPDDQVDIMEKRMATYLRMLHPVMAREVSQHLDEVMAAIRRKDCSVFECPSASHVPVPR